MVRGVGLAATDPVAAVEAALARGETDEFVKPIVLTEGGAPVAPLRDGDGVFCFNYRSDRMRQIVRALMIPGSTGSTWTTARGCAWSR
jgi:2,3-bisphosphoglycerate-independent phosphoglycerate mutase